MAPIFILQGGKETNHTRFTPRNVSRARTNNPGKTTRSISLAIRQTQIHEAPYSTRMRLRFLGVDNKRDQDDMVPRSGRRQLRVRRRKLSLAGLKQTSSVDIACSTVPGTPAARGPSVTGNPCNGKPTLFTRLPSLAPSLPQPPTHQFEKHSIESIDTGATSTSSAGDHRGSLFVCGEHNLRRVGRVCYFWTDWEGAHLA